MTPPVIAIVGFSNSGKTRVATTLIHTLAGRGYRIAAVKHCHHGHQVDLPKKDSARLAAAGASQVIVSSPGQITGIRHTYGDIPLEQIVLSLDPGYDLVIAEGFKNSSVPKVLVLGTEPVLPQPQNVIAVVSDHPIAGNAPCYTFEELDRLAWQVQNEFMGNSRHVPEVSLVVDGVRIPLSRFPSSVLTEVIHGFLETLNVEKTSR